MSRRRPTRTLPPTLMPKPMEVTKEGGSPTTRRLGTEEAQPGQAELAERSTGGGTCKPCKMPRAKEPNDANRTEEPSEVAKENNKSNRTEEPSKVEKTDNRAMVHKGVADATEGGGMKQALLHARHKHALRAHIQTVEGYGLQGLPHRVHCGLGGTTQSNGFAGHRTQHTPRKKGPSALVFL